MVCVRCWTYNHAPYITDALNGFCMQKTTFPFVCTIVDDASIDGEQEVIKNYLHEYFDLEDKSIVRNEETDDYVLTFARHKVNKNCYFAVLYLKYNHYGKPEDKKRKVQYISDWNDFCKYVALCEGDDYWIDKDKLQKQVSILEYNENCTLVYTGYSVVDTLGKHLQGHSIEHRMRYSHTGYLFFDLLVNMNYIMTLTIMTKKNVDKYVEDYYYDYGLFLNACRMGKAVYLSDVTSCYRINPMSIMNTSPQSLNLRMCAIILNEIDRSFDKTITAKNIYNDNYHRMIVGYIIARYVHKSAMKMKFVKYLLLHPFLYVAVIKGLFVRLFYDERLRRYVRNT